MKRFLALIIALAAIGLLGWHVYFKVSPSGKNKTRQRRALPIAVEITPIRKVTIRDIGLFTGTLHPRTQFIVAPKIAGRLEKLLLNIGDQIDRNQLIAVLEDDEYLQQVDQVKAELEVAKAILEESRSMLKISEREFERTKALRKKKIASDSELDTAEAQYRTQEAKLRVAIAQVVQKEAVLKAARVRLSYTRIRAPQEQDNGQRVVGERFVDEGAMLAPNTPIISILDINLMTAVIHVIERDYSRVKIGQEAEVTTDAFPDRKFFGKIRRVAPLLKETSREARVEIEIPNQNALLKPGMFVRVRIEFDRHNNATVVPSDALVKRKGQQGVFSADTSEMKAFFIPVKLGIVNDDLTEVVSPTLTGSVVKLGHHLLEDGSKIILPGTETRGAPKGKRGNKTPGKDRKGATGGKP